MKLPAPPARALRALRLARGAAWVSPEPLNVAPQLVGLPLARPWRRALAMAVDLLVVALVSGAGGFWLAAGLALVVLQLRSLPGPAPAARRVRVGWIGAALIVLLAAQQAGTQWQAWRQRGAAVVVDDEDDDGAASASASASAPPVDSAQRIARLEAELAQARKAATPRWRDRMSTFIDEIGAGFGCGIVYFSLLPAWWGGQTLGKKLLGLRVVELTGKPMTVMRCLKRYGGYAAGMATGGLGFVQLLWDPNRQALHDKAAHTAVIDLRRPRRPPPGAPPP